MTPHEIVIPVVHRRDYTMFYERTGGITLGHVDLRAFSSDIRRSIKVDLDTLQDLLDDAIYAIDDGTRPHLPTLLKMFDFKPCGTALTGNGALVPIFERTRNGQHVRWFDSDHTKQ